MTECRSDDTYDIRRRSTMPEQLPSPSRMSIPRQNPRKASSSKEARIDENGPNGMTSEQFRIYAKEMVDYMADYLDNIHDMRVLPDIHPGYMKTVISSEAPSRGRPWTEIMREFDQHFMPGVTHWAHPRFHAFFPAGNSYPSILGEMISAALGVIGFSWAACPAGTELEILVMDWLAKMLGLPSDFLHENHVGGGALQNSASDCILASLLAARHTALHDLRRGSKEPLKTEDLVFKFVAYCSELAHSSVEKGANLSLVKVRKLETDELFRLRGPTLQKAVEEDQKAGMIPFYVCATLGTTTVCSCDNLDEIASVCKENNLYLHVDAAYGGTAAVCQEFRWMMKGIEHAHSFNVNPSKWMLTNFDCSCLWVKNWREFTSTFTVDPLYLHHYNEKAVDFRHWGIPLSRRPRAIKLYFVLSSYGVTGIQTYIREHVYLAQCFKKLLSENSLFQIIGRVDMGLVCFRLNPDNISDEILETLWLTHSVRNKLMAANFLTRWLLRAINMSAKLHMIPSMLKDAIYVIRFCVNAEKGCQSDMMYAYQVIASMGKEVMDTCALPNMTFTIDQYIMSERMKVSSMLGVGEYEVEVPDQRASMSLTSDIPRAIRMSVLGSRGSIEHLTKDEAKRYVYEAYKAESDIFSTSL